LEVCDLGQAFSCSDGTGAAEVISLGGYVGKILRVDLTGGKVVEEGLPGEDVLRKYVGGCNASGRQSRPPQV